VVEWAVGSLGSRELDFRSIARDVGAPIAKAIDPWFCFLGCVECGYISNV